MGLIQARIDAAREAGTLDVGVETIRAEQIITRSEQTLRTDPVTGAETRLLRLELHLRPRVMHWKRLMQIWDGTREIAYLWNSRSKRVALKVPRSEEHTSELQSLMRISYAVFCLKNKKKIDQHTYT